MTEPRRDRWGRYLLPERELFSAPTTPTASVPYDREREDGGL